MPSSRPQLRGRILITGTSGSGKSTLARRLRQGGIIAVDADAIPGLGRPVDARGHPLPGISHEQYLEVDGWQYFWDERVLKRFLSRNPNVVVCGASDNMFDLDLARLFDLRFFLDVPWSVLHGRLNDPKRDNDWGRDSRPAQRAWVQKAVRTWPGRARSAGFTLVDASAPLETTLGRIRDLSRGPRAPKARRRVGRASPNVAQKGSGELDALETEPTPLVDVQVRLPDYVVAHEPDFRAIGPKVDRVIGTSFPDGRYIVRAVGLDLERDPGLLDEMIAIVLDQGTDKFDPRRQGVAHEQFAAYDYDIHANQVVIRGSRLVDWTGRTREGIDSWFGSTAWHFYHGAREDRGQPVRLDLLIIYDPRRVVRARKRNPRSKGVRRGLAQHLYRFKDRSDKRGALLGLVEVLR